MLKRLLPLIILFFVIPLMIASCSNGSVNTPLPAEAADKKPSEFDKGITFEEAMKKDKPVVVKFYVDWCGACRRVAPVFDYVRSQYSDEAEFVMVNADLNPELTSSFGVRSFPSIFIVNPSTKETKEIPFQSIFSEYSFLEYLRKNAINYRP